MSVQKEIQQSHAAELSSYLRYKRRIMEADSSVSEGAVKRRRVIDYFQGNGSKDWSPKSELIINGTNVTKLLEKFRSRNIILAEEINSVNSIRVLSLSHIFVVDKYSDDDCICSYVAGLKSDIHSLCYKNAHLTTSSKDALYYCKQLSDAIDTDQDPEEVEFKPTTTIDRCIKKIAMELIEDAAAATENSESTFTEKYVLPFVKILLKKRDLQYAVFDAHDEHSKKKPDIMIGFKHKKQYANCVLFEIKRPNATSKYQPESDYAKLLKQMKAALDLEIKLSIKSPVSFGVLCEGFDCCLFRMSLVEDGIYLTTALRKFRLPQDLTTLTEVPRAVEVISYAIDQAVDLKTRFEERAKKEKTPEQQFVKNSFVTKFAKGN
ncbi:hypothetical protein MBANPS3_004735 [Mucor bainieri]